ncbi:MAG TPA: L,D-transpeptidase family protein [Actinopolymorphaceae bacterium]
MAAPPAATHIPAAVPTSSAVPSTPIVPTKPASTERPTPTPTPKPTDTPTPTPRPTATSTPEPIALYKPGTTSSRVRELEARLVALQWLDKKWVDGFYGANTTSAVKGFQAKRGMPVLGYVDHATWTSLVSRTKTPTHDELYPPKDAAGSTAPVKLDSRCLQGRVLCISKSANALSWVVDGKVLSRMDVRFGCVSRTPTREGTFSVHAKVVNEWSRLYNSPMPFAMYFDGGQAVHYSADFAARGYAGCSHGCVNVRDHAAVKALFGQVRVGDKVVVYRS